MGLDDIKNYVTEKAGELIEEIKTSKTVKNTALVASGIALGTAMAFQSIKADLEGVDLVQRDIQARLQAHGYPAESEKTVTDDMYGRFTRLQQKHDEPYRGLTRVQRTHVHLTEAEAEARWHGHRNRRFSILAADEAKEYLTWQETLKLDIVAPKALPVDVDSKATPQELIQRMASIDNDFDKIAPLFWLENADEPLERVHYQVSKTEEHIKKRRYVEAETTADRARNALIASEYGDDYLRAVAEGDKLGIADRVYAYEKAIDEHSPVTSKILTKQQYIDKRKGLKEYLEQRRSNGSLPVQLFKLDTIKYTEQEQAK